jgi:nucleoside-diphosphate-sugar epimerase
MAKGLSSEGELMRVFVTGATGFIGTAVVRELIEKGHQVLGLARTKKGAEQLIKLGAQPHPGSLENLDSLRRGAAASEGVIHLAFAHDLSHVSFAKRFGIIVGGMKRGIIESFGSTMVGIDKSAIAVMGAELVGSDRPFVTVLGTLSLKPGKLGTEQDDTDPSSFGSIRGESETAILSFASKRVRASVIRLPPTVHGQGDKAFMRNVINAAKKQGVSAYIGDGTNRWPAVHRLDAANLLRLALEKGSAGARYHGVSEQGIPLKNVAEMIGQRLNLPVVSKSGKEASKHFGWLSMLLSIDNPASGHWTQKTLGWQPENLGLLADLEQNYLG